MQKLMADEAEKSDSNRGSGEIMAVLKASIISHPLFRQLLEAHLACLHAAPIENYTGEGVEANNDLHDHMNVINHLQLQNLYKVDANGSVATEFEASNMIIDDAEKLRHSIIAAIPFTSEACDPTSFNEDELNQFMVYYISLLQSFKKQLQNHLSTQAIEAITACWEIEQSLYDLMGVSIGASTKSCNTSGLLMPHEFHFLEKNIDQDSYNHVHTFDQRCFANAFPPHGIDKTLMHHIQSELKKELKEDYGSKLREVRDEIMRKRRTGKLPEETSSVLKDWWSNHEKWPYPTEDDKVKLAEESGLELKQINNWFINQRKRIWQVENNLAQSTTSSNEENPITTNSIGTLSLDTNVMHGYYDDHDKIERAVRSIRNNTTNKSYKSMNRI